MEEGEGLVSRLHICICVCMYVHVCARGQLELARERQTTEPLPLDATASRRGFAEAPCESLDPGGCLSCVSSSGQRTPGATEKSRAQLSTVDPSACIDEERRSC